MRAIVISGVGCALAALAGAANGASVTYYFGNISANSVANSLNGQFRLVVSDVVGQPNQADFTFFNDVGLASSITDVYFDDGTLLSIATITQSAGVSYGTPATPGNLPDGNTLAVPFVTTAGFSADSNPPVAANGVNASGEWVNIRFNLQSGQTYTDVLAAFALGFSNPAATGSLRVGIHAQALPDGSSAGFVTTLIPLPASVWAGGASLAGLAGFGLIRRRAFKA